ncbi:MAG TPA: hypothetical protein DEP51_06690 [Clostridiales bacterium]|nr:hypothetical protein [Clostridiales bacterium]
MDDKMITYLALLAGAIFFFIIVLIIALFAIRLKEKREEERLKEQENQANLVTKPKKNYTQESIIDFMEFEKIEDNMIIQKNGKFLMVVECQGINYDLMSEMEKVSVEQGFISFLNTLRYPIQIYIQTRTINLERSIQGYKRKLNEIKSKYSIAKTEYENKVKNKNVSKEDVDRAKYELVKQKNLKDYTEDIIRDIERQSLNQSILSKKYFVIISCYRSELVSGDFDKTEVENMAFSELYTRARSVINSLFSCQVTGRVLTSEELTELLYVAYNRDEADLFWMDKVRQAGFDELYSTAPDVMDKKIKLLNKQIEEKSIQLANEKIEMARSEKDIEYAEKEKNAQKLINKKAKELIKKHKRYVGEETARKAIEKIDEDEAGNNPKNNSQEDKFKEEINNGIIQEKAKRGRPRKK